MRTINHMQGDTCKGFDELANKNQLAFKLVLNMAMFGICCGQATIIVLDCAGQPYRVGRDAQKLEMH